MKASEEGAMQANFVSTIPNVKKIAVVIKMPVLQWKGLCLLQKLKD